jgi:hypothetical protein
VTADPRYADALKVAVCEYLLGVNRDFERDGGSPLIAPTAINWLGDGIVSAVLAVPAP